MEHIELRLTGHKLDTGELDDLSTLFPETAVAFWAEQNGGMIEASLQERVFITSFLKFRESDSGNDIEKVRELISDVLPVEFIPMARTGRGFLCFKGNEVHELIRESGSSERICSSFTEFIRNLSIDDY